MEHEGRRGREIPIWMLHRYDMHSSSLTLSKAVLGPLDSSFDFSVERMIITGPNMEAWMPLMTSLLGQNIALVNLSSMTPLFDSKSTTG